MPELFSACLVNEVMSHHVFCF